MPLIIDCYNLLHAPMPPRLAGLDEVRLCMLLSRVPWARDRAVVVCDGAPKPLGLVESPAPNVDLVYSGPKRTADDVIRQMIIDDSAPKRLIVVSNDHEIQRAAGRRSARVWSCEKFIHELIISAAPGSGAGESSVPPMKQQQGPISDAEVQGWLDRFGIDGEQPIDRDDKRPWWEANNLH